MCADEGLCSLTVAQAVLLSVMSEAAVRELERDDLLPLSGVARTLSQASAEPSSFEHHAAVTKSRQCTDYYLPAMLGSSW